MPKRKEVSQYNTVMLLPYDRKHPFRFSFNKKTMILFFTIITFLFVFCIVNLLFLQFIKVEHKKESVELQHWDKTLYLVNKSIEDLYFLNHTFEDLGENFFKKIWKNSLDVKIKEESLSNNFLKATMSLNNALTLLIKRQAIQKNLPLGWPIKDALITSKYGERVDPITYERGSFHTGYDFANVVGTPVYATSDGEIVFAGNNNTGYGNHVRIQHKYGLVTLYAHGSRVVATPKSFVKKGDVIMYLGQSGNVTGPHLHYEILLMNFTDEFNKISIPLNPEPFISDNI